jgi:hypothetical protein
MALGLGSGIAMIARGTILYRTVSPGVAYTTAGFLKPVHAVGLRAIVVLPLVAELPGFGAGTSSAACASSPSPPSRACCHTRRPGPVAQLDLTRSDASGLGPMGGA